MNSGNSRAEDRGALPTFLARAQEEERVRSALARLGYRRVLATYSWQRKNEMASQEFYGLTRDGLAPSMEFVGDWLRAEKKRIRAEVRSTFLTAMLVTFGAGLILSLSLTLFR